MFFYCQKTDKLDVKAKKTVKEMRMSLTLENYLNRLGLHYPPARGGESLLFEVQERQLMKIPFENLDCLHGIDISLNPRELEAKILLNQRGGYCFELNLLLLEGLSLMGFAVKPVLSRVMYRGIGINPKTHIFLIAEIDGKQWLVDAGFGGPGLFHPMPFELNRIDQQVNGSFRLVQDAEFGFILQKAIKVSDQWQNVFAFTTDKVYLPDLEMSNFYTSKLPESHFRHNLIAALFNEEGRTTLLNRKMTRTFHDGRLESFDIATVAELKSILSNDFQIALPAHFNFSRFWSSHESV